MRTFIGVPLSEAARAAVAGLQRRLEASGADVRWTGPGSLHLTLKFLGDIDAARCAAAEALLRRIGAQFPAFSMRLEGCGAFPASGAPRIIWAGVSDGRQEAARLAAAIEGQGRALGWAAEERAFTAHVTIGRVTSARGAGRLRRGLEDAVWEAPPAWTVGAVVLYESRLDAAGARYTPLATVPLTGTPASASASPARPGPPAS